MEILLSVKLILRVYLSYDKSIELLEMLIAKSSSLKCQRKVKKYRNAEFIKKDDL